MPDLHPRSTREVCGSRRLTPILQGVGVVVAILLAIGFVGLPLYIYFAVPPPPPALLAPLGGIP